MYDVIVFTVFNTEILCKTYQIYGYNRNTRRRDGLWVAVSSIYPSEQFVTPTCKIEFVVLVVKLKMSNVYFSCSYVTPDSDSAVY